MKLVRKKKYLVVQTKKFVRFEFTYESRRMRYFNIYNKENSILEEGEKFRSTY